MKFFTFFHSKDTFDSFDKALLPGIAFIEETGQIWAKNSYFGNNTSHCDTITEFLNLKLSANLDNTLYTIGPNASQVYEGTPDISYQTVLYIKESLLIWYRGTLYNCASNETEHINLVPLGNLTFDEDIIIQDDLITDVLRDSINRLVKTNSEEKQLKLTLLIQGCVCEGILQNISLNIDDEDGYYFQSSFSMVGVLSNEMPTLPAFLLLFNLTWEWRSQRSPLTIYISSSTTSTNNLYTEDFTNILLINYGIAANNPYEKIMVDKFLQMGYSLVEAQEALLLNPSIEDLDKSISIYASYTPSSSTLLGNIIPKDLAFIPKIDTSLISNFSRAFANSKVKYIPLLDTSKGTNFSGMFSGCSELRKVPSFDMTLGTNFNTAFLDCINLESVSNIRFGSPSTVTNMFNGCLKLTVAPTINLSSASTLDKVFANTLINDYSNVTWGQPKKLLATFLNTPIESPPKLDLSLTTSITNTFLFCYNIKYLDENSITLPNVNYSGRLLGGCTSLKSCSLDFSKSDNVSFASCFSLETVSNLNNVRSSLISFAYCYSLQSIEDLYFDSYAASTDSETMFIDCVSLQHMKMYNLGAKSQCTVVVLAGAENLTHDSLVFCLLTNSYNRAAAGYTNMRIKLCEKLRSKLTAQEEAAIKAKGYVIEVV